MTSSSEPAPMAKRIIDGGVIAIDGPSGSGKTTVAKAVAERLGVAYLDTGAMYRAVAWACKRAGVSPSDEVVVGAVARTTDITVSGDPSVAQVVIVDGVDVSSEIRSVEITTIVTPIAANAAVRAELVARQRAWAIANGGGVLEGRDIATVVFPDAPVKVYLTADAGERARRRHGESSGQRLEAIAADIERRDTADSTRSADPLQVAAGATVIDTTGLSVDDVVDRIVALLPEAAPAAAPSSGTSGTSGRAPVSALPASPPGHAPTKRQLRMFGVVRVVSEDDSA